MKNKSHARISSLIPNFRYIATPVVLGLCLVHSASAAITTWTGASSNDWSTAGNWDNGLPGGNDAVFAAADATGTTGPLGTANNLVDAVTTVASLKYTNLGTTGYHTTEIPTGVTLTVNGGGTNIEVQSPTTGTTDVVYATIRGDGTLAVNNTAATLYVGQGSATVSAARRATLDLSGLETFSGALSQIVIGRQSLASAPNRPQGTLRLARTNTLSLSGNPGILLGQISSNNGTGTAQLLELGTSNTIRSNNGITVGGRKGNGTVRFNSETVAPGTGSAVFRNLSGTGRQTNWLIGDNSQQTGTPSGTTSTGVVDFSVYGEVDALVDVMILGRATAEANTPNYTQGTLTFDKGTINTNSLTAGIQPATSTVPGNARGTVNVNGTGKLLVNGNVTLGRDIGEATYNAQGLINIVGGEVTISGDVICGTGTGNTITLTAGSLTLGGKVGDDSVVGDAPLETLQLNGGTFTFDFGSTPIPAGSRAKVVNLNVPNIISLDIAGTNLSTGTVELIKYTTFDEASEFANLNLTLPPRVVANLVNNTANSSVDLDIVSVSINKWSGAVNSDWDIDTTSNWALFPGNTPSTYEQTVVPGEPVVFDDTAAGTKTVNLTTILSPAQVLVETDNTYTFTGPGAISGTGDLLKQGSGALVLETVNAYTGATSISAGTLEVRGSVANSSGISNEGSLVFNSSSAQSYSNAISGSGSLTKQGVGTLVLAGSNNYSGPTTVSQGILQIGIGTTVGTLGANSDTLIESGAELRIERSTDSFGYVYTRELSGDGTVSIPSSRRFNFQTNNQTASGSLSFIMNGILGINTGSGVTSVHLGELTGSGNIQRAGSAPANPQPVVLTIGGKNTSSTFSGNITGIAEFAVEKVGSGTLTLAGTFSHGGATTVSSGTLALGASAFIPNSSSFTIATEAGLDASAKTSFAMAATQPFTFGIDPAASGTTGTLSAQELDITSAVVSLDITGTLDDPAYVLATYTSLTGTAFATEPTIPPGYELQYDYQGDKIALVAGTSSDFASWQAVNGATGGLDADHDGDGVSDGIEYFLGGPNGDTTGFTALPGVVDTAGTLSVTWTMAADYAGAYPGDYVVQTSTTLSGTWNDETVGGSGNVTITGDDVKYTFPGGTKNFVRLKVTGP